jgi:osmotically-inducible protein OsmY
MHVALRVGRVRALVPQQAEEEQREYELKWDPDIDPSDIEVAVKDGAVTLSGFARSFRQRRKAEEDATRVRGARGVANDVEVRLPLINN